MRHPLATTRASPRATSARRTFERGAMRHSTARPSSGSATKRRCRPRTPCAERTVDLGGALGHARAHRLPHAPRVRRAARGGVRAPYGGLELRRDRARGGGILSTVRATRCGRRRSSWSAKRAAPAVAAAGRRDDRRDQVRLRADVRRRTTMLLAARELGGRISGHGATTLLARTRVPPEFTGRADEYIDVVCARLAAAAVAESTRTAGARRHASMCSARASRSTPRSATGCSRAPRDLGLPVRLHAEQLANIGGSRSRRASSRARPAITSSTRPSLMSSRWRAPAPSPCCCRSRITRSPSSNCHRSSSCAGTACRSRSRAMPTRVGAGRLAAARDEHGTPPVRTHRRRSARGVTRNAARALGVHATRGMLVAGHDGRFRRLVDRDARRARLLDRLQPLQQRRAQWRVRARAPTVTWRQPRGAR